MEHPLWARPLLGTGDPTVWHPANLGSCLQGAYSLVGRMSKKHNRTVSHLITVVTKATEERRGCTEAYHRGPNLLGK